VVVGIIIPVVTGGGTGIGKAIAKQFLNLGAKVAICGRRAEVVKATAEEFSSTFDSNNNESSSRIYQQTCDIRDPNSVKSFVDNVIKHFNSNKITILVNNAGGQFPIQAKDLSSKGFESVVRNNLFGTWNMTSYVAKQCMLPNKRGRIVNITANVRNGFPGMVHTGAARAGVENLTKTLCVEWGRFGIAINSVAPGVIENSGTARYDPKLIQDSLATIPLQRFGTDEDVSNLVTFLSSSLGSFITGQIYYIDGGHSVAGRPAFEHLTINPKL